MLNIDDMKNILFYLSTNSAFPIMPEDIILQFLLYNCVYIQMCRFDSGCKLSPTRRLANGLWTSIRILFLPFWSNFHYYP